MTVFDNTIQAERLGIFSKGKISAKSGNQLVTNVLKSPARALEIGANVATAAVSGNPKAASWTLPEVIKISHEGRGLYLGKFIWFYTI